MSQPKYLNFFACCQHLLSTKISHLSGSCPTNVIVSLQQCVRINYNAAVAVVTLLKAYVCSYAAVLPLCLAQRLRPQKLRFVAQP